MIGVLRVKKFQGLAFNSLYIHHIFACFLSFFLFFSFFYSMCVRFFIFIFVWIRLK